MTKSEGTEFVAVISPTVLTGCCLQNPMAQKPSDISWILLNRKKKINVAEL